MLDGLATNTQRLPLSLSEDFSGSHYIFQFYKVVHRLERYLSDLSNQKIPLLNLHGQV